MLGKFWNIFIGSFCMHKWEIIDKGKLRQNGVDDLPTGIIFFLQCSKCGDIKSRRINA